MFNLIQSSRIWNARHGGVYVPITDNTQPNPYLDIPDRDIVSTKGMKLTKINPAFMTRQISEIAVELHHVVFHITSLKPIRPANKADEWETMVLREFEKGREEKISLINDNTGRVFRYMAVLKVKKSCLKCHEKQGYKTGDIRGGISVTIKSDHLFRHFNSQRNRIVILHVLIFLIITSLMIYIFLIQRKFWISMKQIGDKQEDIINERTSELAGLNDQLRLEINRRKNREEEISYRLRIEESLLLISNIFSSSSDPDIKAVLSFLGETSKVDHVFISLHNKDVNRLYHWNGKSTEIISGETYDEEKFNFPWLTEKMRDNDYVVIYDRNEIDEHGAREREFLKSFGILSFIAVPIIIRKELLFGFTGIGYHLKGFEWSKNHIRIIRLINEMIANYLAREESRDVIKRSLKEKDVLLKEIHHRVKNNMQLISSLIYLQSESLQDNTLSAILTDSQNRIKSMAMIHEKLYQSDDLAVIDFNEYTRDLVSTILTSHRDLSVSSGISVSFNIQNLLLDINTAIPCGLILNELISNALKHAFTPGVKGSLSVDLVSEDSCRYKLTVKDSGKGFPEKPDFKNLNTMGLKLVYTLATRQLNGSIDIDITKGAGAVVKIVFKPLESSAESRVI